MRIGFLLSVICCCLIFSSCKKDVDYHRLKYELKFLQVEPTNYPNDFSISISPNYVEEAYKENGTYNKAGIYHPDPKLFPAIEKPVVGTLWTYEYLGLKSGDEVYFNTSGKIAYYYEMRVYIDDVEVSYRKVKVFDDRYYQDFVVESSGKNEDTTGSATIKFTYY